MCTVTFCIIRGPEYSISFVFKTQSLPIVPVPAQYQETATTRAAQLQALSILFRIHELTDAHDSLKSLGLVKISNPSPSPSVIFSVVLMRVSKTEGAELRKEYRRKVCICLAVDVNCAKKIHFKSFKQFRLQRS